MPTKQETFNTTPVVPHPVHPDSPDYSRKSDMEILYQNIRPKESAESEKEYLYRLADSVQRLTGIRLESKRDMGDLGLYKDSPPTTASEGETHTKKPLYEESVMIFFHTWLGVKLAFLVPPQFQEKIAPLTLNAVIDAYDLEKSQFLESKFTSTDENSPEIIIGDKVKAINSQIKRIQDQFAARRKVSAKHTR